jgi:hypothetical protein
MSFNPEARSVSHSNPLYSHDNGIRTNPGFQPAKKEIISNPAFMGRDVVSAAYEPKQGILAKLFKNKNQNVSA